MKFWKSLRNLIDETLPDWRDKFLSYKDLKKKLKLIHPVSGYPIPNPSKRHKISDNNAANRGESFGEAEIEVSKAVIDFVRLLEEEVDKFNGFFVEKEEEYVIRWKELQDGVANVKDPNEEMRVGREIADLHGEMVLLENYSALNYTGLVKILKKYEKRSGALIRLPFIQRLLNQPFYTTDLLEKLVKDCEMALECLFSANVQTSALLFSTNDETAPANEKKMKVPEGLAEIEHMESIYMKLTLSALRVLKEIRRGSSTVSMFSLPPMQCDLGGRKWKIARREIEQIAE